MKNNISNEPRKDYQAPSFRLIEMKLETSVCSDPLPGGNEDIGYEDWD